MKRTEAIAWAREHGIDPEAAVARIEAEIARRGTSWQAVTLHVSEADATDWTPSGYRKYTTGEYVSKAYRANYGWKNTHYEHAALRITFAAACAMVPA